MPLETQLGSGAIEQLQNSLPRPISDSSGLRQRHCNSTSYTASQDTTKAGRSIQPPTLSWNEIPGWQRDNDYLLTGYRRVQESWSGCAGTLFGYLHNETVNIYSHLIGSLMFLFFTATFHTVHISARSATTWADSTIFAIFLVSAVFCLICSTGYHTVSCHSEMVSKRWQAFDYAGIVALTVGSIFSCIYYGFFCQSHTQVVYLSAITAIGLGSGYIVLNPEYAKPTYRRARTKVFMGLGLSAVFPVAHLFVFHGFHTLLFEMGFWWLIASGCLYIGGAFLYANRIPECLLPGNFDYFFASHQIFHVCVVVAALAHYKCIIVAFDYWHSRPGICET